MEIAGRKIGPNHPPLVIAEIGINHGGDLTVAKEMVRLAAGAGCEMIKHQTHIIEDEMTEEAKSIFPPNADVSIWHVMERCSLSQEDERELKRYSEELGMIWISTPFSRAAAALRSDLTRPPRRPSATAAGFLGCFAGGSNENECGPWATFAV